MSFPAGAMPELLEVRRQEILGPSSRVPGADRGGGRPEPAATEPATEPAKTSGRAARVGALAQMLLGSARRRA